MGNPRDKKKSVHKILSFLGYGISVENTTKFAVHRNFLFFGILDISGISQKMSGTKNFFVFWDIEDFRDIPKSQ